MVGKVGGKGDLVGTEDVEKWRSGEMGGRDKWKEELGAREKRKGQVSVKGEWRIEDGRKRSREEVSEETRPGGPPCL